MTTNFSLINGYVAMSPQINTENGEAFLWLQTRRISFRKGLVDSEYRYDYTPVATSNPKMLKIIKEIKPGDFVEVQGVIRNKKAKKISYCEHCGSLNYKEGDFVFVEPIFIDIRKRDVSEDEVATLLNNFKEVSNRVLLMGFLTKNPKEYKIQGKKKGMETVVATYPLKVFRTIRIEDNGVDDEDSDCIFVKSFNDNAKQDLEYLRSSNHVLVNGAFQTRQNIKRPQICTNCKKEYYWEDFSSEVVPYHTEYLFDAKEVNNKNKKIKKILD